MELWIQNKLFSLRGHSTVKDADGKDWLKIRGKLFTITHKKFVYDLNDKLLYKVRLKFFHVLPTALIYDANGEKVAAIKKKFSINQGFIIQGYKDQIRIDGNFIGWNFKVYKNDKLIGSINRQVSWTDTFVLHIEDEGEYAFFVALVIAIDNIYDHKQGSKN